MPGGRRSVVSPARLLAVTWTMSSGWCPTWSTRTGSLASSCVFRYTALAKKLRELQSTMKVNTFPSKQVVAHDDTMQVPVMQCIPSVSEPVVLTYEPVEGMEGVGCLTKEMIIDACKEATQLAVHTFKMLTRVRWAICI